VANDPSPLKLAGFHRRPPHGLQAKVPENATALPGPIARRRFRHSLTAINFARSSACSHLLSVNPVALPTSSAFSRSRRRWR